MEASRKQLLSMLTTLDPLVEGGVKVVLLSQNGVSLLPRAVVAGSLSAIESYNAEQVESIAMLNKINGAIFPMSSELVGAAEMRELVDEAAESLDQEIASLVAKVAEQKAKFFPDGLDQAVNAVTALMVASVQGASETSGEELALPFIQQHQSLLRCHSEVEQMEARITVLRGYRQNLTVFDNYQKVLFDNDLLQEALDDAGMAKWESRKLRMIVNPVRAHCDLSDHEKLCAIDPVNLWQIGMDICDLSRRMEIAHGDLHSKNIMLVRGPDRFYAVLIDPKLCHKEIADSIADGLSKSAAVDKFLEEITPEIRPRHEISAAEKRSIVKFGRKPREPKGYDVYGLVPALRAIVAALRDNNAAADVVQEAHLATLPEVLLEDDSAHTAGATLVEFVEAKGLFSNPQYYTRRYNELAKDLSLSLASGLVRYKESVVACAVARSSARSLFNDKAVYMEMREIRRQDTCDVDSFADDPWRDDADLPIDESEYEVETELDKYIDDGLDPCNGGAEKVPSPDTVVTSQYGKKF